MLAEAEVRGLYEAQYRMSHFYIIWYIKPKF